MSCAPTAGELDVDVVEGDDALDRCRTDWVRLFQRRPGEPSASWEWTMALVRHQLRAGDRWFVLRLRRGRCTVGLVPLLFRRVRTLLGDSGVLMPMSELSATHSDLLIVAEDEPVAAFVRALSRLDVDWHCFRMTRLLASNPLVPRLRRAFRAHLQVIRPGLPAYHLDLPSTFEAYLASRSAKFRNHLKRTTARLERAGRVEVHTVSEPSHLDAAFEALLEVERASWKHERHSSIAAVPVQRAFYRELASGALASGHLHLRWLTLDGQPLAYNLGYLTAGTYHYLKTSYAHHSRPLSPSTYLRACLIRELIERGVGQFDFPGEPYAWESQWASDLRPRATFAAYPRTLRGRLLAWRERVRPRSRGPAPSDTPGASSAASA